MSDRRNCRLGGPPVAPLLAKSLIVTCLMLLLSTMVSSQIGSLTGALTGTLSKLERTLLDLVNQRTLFSPPVEIIVQFTVNGKVGGVPVTSSNDLKLIADAVNKGADLIRSLGGTVTGRYTNLAAVSATLSLPAVPLLAGNALVARISLDWPVPGSLDTSAAATGADQAWAGTSSRPGVTGRGVGVAVIDAGIDTSADLEGRMPTQLSFLKKNDTKDKYGHGVHVAGIIAGSGASSAEGSGFAAQYKGIAPGATIHSLRVLDKYGIGKSSEVLSAIDWCITNRQANNLRVINLSLGHAIQESYKTDPMCRMVEAAVSNKIAVVVSAGNHGKLSDGTIVYGGINSPANDPAAIAVGAANTKATVSRSDDAVASYSSRGPTAIDGLIKPDLVAPGNKIVSTSDKTSTLYKKFPSNIVYPAGAASGESPYFTLSGTSMAAPVVSGALALMFEVNPSLTPNVAKAILMYTAERKQESILAQGAGHLNVDGAVRLAYAISPYSGNLATGTQWIASPSSITPYSTIGGVGIMWGEGIMWGDGIMWGEGIMWGDGIMWGEGIMWGDGIMWGEGIMWGDSLLMYKQPAMADGIMWGETSDWVNGARIRTTGVRSKTSDKWYPRFLDPDTIGGTEAILANAEGGSASGLRIASSGSWFIPPK